MKPERIGLELRRRGLIRWISIQRPELQAIRRTFVFPTFLSATKFVDVAGHAATDMEVFPHVEVFTQVAEAVPTQVQITFADPDLQDMHFLLACVLDGLYAEDMAEFSESMTVSQETETASAVTLAEAE